MTFLNEAETNHLQVQDNQDKTSIERIKALNLSVLKDIYGYDGFRSQQERVTNAVASGNDSLVLMQTGGGKSLCFQIPAMTMKREKNNNGVCLVISPLKALIRDQVHDINHTGKMVGRYLIADDQGEVKRLEHNHQETMRLLGEGKLDFLYLAPERLEKNENGRNRVLDIIKENNIPVNLIVFDEAHYTLMTNEDFRPSYMRLSELVSDFPDAVKVALTATADIYAQREIIKRTGLRTPKIFIDDDYSRNHSVNITLDSGEKKKREANMFTIIAPLRERCGIVYANRKKRLKELHDLYEHSFPDDHIWYYDGDTPQERRMVVEDEFQIASDGIIFATNAFGMGVNKSDIYYVYHDGAPRSVSDFIQEIGRAGRDRSISSSSYAFMSYADLAGSFTTLRDHNTTLARKRYASLVNVVMSTKCRNVLLAESLGVHAEKCGLCDNCTRPAKTLETDDSNSDALLVLDLVQEIGKKKKSLTRKHIADIVRGINSGRGKTDGWAFLQSFGKSTPNKGLNYWENMVFYLISREFLEFNVYKFSQDGFETKIAYVVLTALGRKALREKIIVTQEYPVREPAEGKKESNKRVVGKRLKESAPEFMHKMMEDLVQLTHELGEDASLEDVMIASDDTLINIVETGKLDPDCVSLHPLVDYSEFSERVQALIAKYYPKDNAKEESSVTFDW